MRAANLVSMVIRAAGIAVSGIPAGPYRCAVLRGAGQEESVGCLCHIVLSPSAIGVQFFDPNHRHRPEIPRLIAARGSAKYQSPPRRNAEHVERRVAAGSAEYDVACDTRRAECVVTHRRNGRVGQRGRIRRHRCGQGNPNAQQPVKHGNRGSRWDLHSVYYAPTHTPAQDNSFGSLVPSYPPRFAEPCRRPRHRFGNRIFLHRVFERPYQSILMRIHRRRAA